MCFCMYCLSNQYDKCELVGYRPTKETKDESMD